MVSAIKISEHTMNTRKYVVEPEIKNGIFALPTSIVISKIKISFSKA